MDSIFRNTNFYTLSDPQPTWLFDVSFYSVSDDDNNHGAGFIEIFNKYLLITSVTLPSHTTEIVTKKYFGSEKYNKLQKDIANVLGISQQYYSEYENGNRPIPVQHLITLAKYYNTTIDYIVGLTDEKDKKSS